MRLKVSNRRWKMGKNYSLLQSPSWGFLNGKDWMCYQVMSSSTKYVEITDMRDEKGLDRISSLPDELICYIVSFLPMLGAVQTSMLSTRWRYIFTLTTNLSFDDQEYFNFHGKPSSDENKIPNTGFERFVYKVLALYSRPSIQKFSLKLRTCKYACSDIFEWISAAILKGVQHLDLDGNSYPDLYLPMCVFNSKTLVTLDISSSGTQIYLKAPNAVCFPSLRVLKLKNVRFLDHVRVSALALEKLMVYLFQGYVEIDAPNLTKLLYFTIKSSDMILSLKKPCSLSTIELTVVDSSDPPPQAVVSLITGAQRTKELILRVHFLKFFTRVDDSQIPTYSKLERLCLDYICDDTWKYVTFWLANSPRLETIVFNKGLFNGTLKCSIITHEWDPSMELAPFSSNVKTIEVRIFEGRKMELLLLKYLLKNAGVLKRLILYKYRYMKTETESRVLKELLMLPKASTNCTIELK